MNKERLIIIEDDLLLRIYISENDKLHGIPLYEAYEAIVKHAREIGLAGATVSRGILGFGADKRMHSAKLVDLSENLPIIVEIIDTEENINLILPFLEDNMNDGFVTMEKVHVTKYRQNAADQRQRH